jgi:hypothetical protein
MKKLLTFFCYLMIWIFSFKLFDLYIEEYNFSKDKIKKICIFGLIIFTIIYSIFPYD